MKLLAYPRPKNDTGYGLHWGTGDSRVEDLRRFLPLCKEMGVSWIKFLGKDSSSDLAFVELCRANDIEPVCRLYVYNPHPYWVPSVRLVQRYVQSGVRYFEMGNEPNLDTEWDSWEWAKGGQPNRVGEQLVRSIRVVKAGGGIPGLYAMTPGGLITHEEFFAKMLAHAANVLYLEGGESIEQLLDGCWIASHPRTVNHPLDYRQDTTAFLGYEWFDDHLKNTYGVELPQIGTEAGPEPGWHQDSRYPIITRESHRDLILESVRGFRDGRWRSSLFALCFWHLGGEVLGNRSFQGAAWLDSDYPPGGELPIVQALRAEPKFIRLFPVDPVVVSPVEPASPVVEEPMTWSFPFVQLQSPSQGENGVPVPRLETRGVVLHATRSGRATNTLEQEYRGTVNYMMRPETVSAQALVGPSEVTFLVEMENLAWHAQENNRTHLSAELAQPTLETSLTNFQYEATAEILKAWAKVYGFPLTQVFSEYEPGLVEHKDTSQGKRWGKSDVGPQLDWEKLMSLFSTQPSRRPATIPGFSVVSNERWECDLTGADLTYRMLQLYRESNGLYWLGYPRTRGWRTIDGKLSKVFQRAIVEIKSQYVRDGQVDPTISAVELFELRLLGDEYLQARGEL